MAIDREGIIKGVLLGQGVPAFGPFKPGSWPYHPGLKPMPRNIAAARALLSGLEPGTYKRGGSEHLRVWLAERLGEASGAENQAGAPWLVYYARALGNRVGDGVDLHSTPPVTGMLTLGDRCSVEPEVDLTGHWIDGDLFHVGPISIGNDATIGARTTLLPGAVVGKNADVAPGSGVIGKVKAGQYWKGSPAVKSGKAHHPWPKERPGRAPIWVGMYGVTSVLLGGLPILALAAGLAVLILPVRHTHSLPEAVLPVALWTPVAAVVAMALKLASAASVACLTAFCTESKALLAADTALFITATAVSEPAGAFLAALSTRLVKAFCASVAWASKALPNSAPVPEAMSYRWRL